jgi:hypothetical protein
MTNPTIIALTGAAGSGKDTVADLLVKHAGFTKLAFADPLRQEVCDAFRSEPLELTRRETKEHPITRLALRQCLSGGFVGRMIIHFGEQDIKLDLSAPRSPRQIMQWWGTEYRRKQDPAYWTRRTSLCINHLLRTRLASRIVITDCRFNNEADTVRIDHDGEVWQVLRPGFEPHTGHASDVSGAELAPDRQIHNTGGPHQLFENVLAAFWAHDAGLQNVKVNISQEYAA